MEMILFDGKEITKRDGKIKVYTSTVP